MKTEITKIVGSWLDVLNACRATVKKSPLANEPSVEFRRRMMIAEHSPIRELSVSFSWKNIQYWVAMHWKTHKWESWVDTQRNDRQSRYDRNKAPQDTLIDFYGHPNAQNTIDTWRKRLCFQASAETRKYAEDFKKALREVEPEWSDVLVPNCVYRCGCPEPNGCGYYQWLIAQNQKISSTNIQERYNSYNEVFYDK